MLMQAAPPGRMARAQKGAQAFLQHHRADQPQKDDIAQLDDQLDLTHALQDVEDQHPKGRTHHAPGQQHATHPEIDGLALHMRQNARHGRGHDLIGPGRHRDGGRDADEEQQGRDQKAAADAEQTAHDADQPAQTHQGEGVDRDLCNGKIDLHCVPACAALKGRMPCPAPKVKPLRPLAAPLPVRQAAMGWRDAPAPDGAGTG
ncbi:hypothetical protein PANO111632_14310 [Paracoccus nototheniae]